MNIILKIIFWYNLCTANILRLFIILVLFIAGVIIGNVYITQKNFDQKSIVVPQKPKTSFNVENIPPIEIILKEAENYKALLIAFPYFLALLAILLCQIKLINF